MASATGVTLVTASPLKLEFVYQPLKLYPSLLATGRVYSSPMETSTAAISVPPFVSNEKLTFSAQAVTKNADTKVNVATKNA